MSSSQTPVVPSSHRGFFPGMNRSFQHGDAERGRSRRDRERDRGDRGSSLPTPTSFVRFNSVGVQETQDWLQALESVNNRLDTIECNLRSQTQGGVQTRQDLQAISSRIDNDITDFEAYKKYVENRIGRDEEVI